MQVSAISSSTQGFSGRARKRDNIDEVISWNDDQLRSIAYLKTLQKDKQRRKNVNRLFTAVPVVAALSAGILTKGKASMFGKEVGGFAAKTVNGMKAGGYWAMLLGTASAIGLTTNALTRKSDSVREFGRNHPLLTLGTQIGALFAAVTYLPKGASKLYSMIKPEVIAKAGKGVGEVAEHINRYIKTPKFMQGWGETISSHVPEVVKDAGKVALAWAPDVTLVTAGIAALRGYTNTAVDMNNTYLQLKDRQHQLAQARIKELKQMS